MSNALRDLTRYNTNCSEEHIDAMHRAMSYAIATPGRGLKLLLWFSWVDDCFLTGPTADLLQYEKEFSLILLLYVPPME
jgi:hypothetical protein